MVPVLHVPDAAEAATIWNPLLAWYAAHHRDLPWRRTPEPYAIWVSEVMLQQTQVATVKPYFERWMKAFPTLQSLAHAEEASVLAHWQGLGYYSRARSLQRGARYVVENLSGQIPTQPTELQALPGVGPYTAGAIASIAFERDAPLVDGNVARVLARLFALTGPVQKPPIKQHLWVLAEALIPQGKARHFNQALLELGAWCCTPTKPRCSDCPVRGQCAALRSGQVDSIPAPQLRPKTTVIEAVAALVVRRGEWLVTQLPANAPRWAGMWQFPNREVPAGGSKERAAEQCLTELTRGRSSAGEQLFELKHSVTRYRIHLRAIECSLAEAARTPAYAAVVRWVTPAAAEALAMPAAHRKIMRWLGANQPDGKSA